MPGPCSLPNGPKSRWEELNSTVCDLHNDCHPNHRKMGKDGGGAIEIAHVWVTLREYLFKRNRLTTGKTR